MVTVLRKKKCGMTREEIISEGKMTDNGLLTAVLADLEHCGFIRHYRAIGKKAKESLFQLIDSFTLFYFKFLETREGGSHYWSSVTGSPRYNTWCGFAFERVCLMHVAQIKQRLSITGILTQEYSWQSRMPDAVQIDLLIDRSDGIINLCEMKFSQYEFKIDKAYDAQLRRKKAVFCKKTATRKAVHLTMVTTYGLEPGMYSDSIQNQVTMDDLFVSVS